MGSLLGENDGQDNGDDDEDEDDNAETPPLPLAGVAGALDGRIGMLITLVDVLGGVLGVVLDLDDGLLLLLDQDGEVLEHGGELIQGLLNALQLVVARAHIAQDIGGLSHPVAPELF